MPQLTSVQTMQLSTDPTKRSRLSVTARSGRLRVGSACDRARLEQARRRCWEHIAAPKRACLHAVLAICSGQSLLASAERFCVPTDALKKCCDIINNAGAETFLAMLAKPDAEWHVPDLRLPQQHKRRRLSGLMPAPIAAPVAIITPPCTSPDLKPMPLSLLTPPLTLSPSATSPFDEPATERQCGRTAEVHRAARVQTPVVEQDEQERFQSIKAAIEMFAAQDPDLFTSPARRAPIDRQTYYAALPTLQMLDEDLGLWVHSPMGSLWDI